EKISQRDCCESDRAREKNRRMIAIEALDMARHEFERGDRRAILSGLNLCAANNIPIPRWLADAFAETVRDVKAFKYSSWDAALGSPHRGAKGGKRGAGPKIAARRAYKELEIPAVLAE